MFYKDNIIYTYLSKENQIEVPKGMWKKLDMGLN